MPKFAKIFISFVLVTLLFSPAVLAQTQKNTSGSEGLIISPPIQEVEAIPGKTYSIDYDVENNTALDTVKVDTSIETFEEGSIPGSANVVPFKPEKDQSYWLNVPKSQDFKKNVNTKVSYQLTIPENIQPGAYFFAIVYQPKLAEKQEVGGKNAVVLQSRIATLLFVNIGGDNSKQPLIENYKISPQWVDTLFDKVEVSYDIQVKGSSFYRPTGNLFLSDDRSDDITTLTSILSDKLILPGGKRSYNECFGNNIFQTKCTDISAIKLPIFGQKSFDLRFDFTDGSGNPQSVVAKKQVIFFPYKTLLIIIGIILIVFTGYRRYKRIKK
jgi:hypothetical protein